MAGGLGFRVHYNPKGREQDAPGLVGRGKHLDRRQVRVSIEAARGQQVSVAHAGQPKRSSRKRHAVELPCVRARLVLARMLCAKQL